MRLTGMMAGLLASGLLCGAVAGQGVQLGVKGGVNLADLRITGNDDAPDTKARTDFVGGIFASLALNRNVSVQPELVYSRKGTKVEERSIEGTDVSTFIKVSYVEVPLLLRVQSAAPGASLVPYVAVGPALALKVKCNIVLTDGNLSASSPCEDGVGDSVLKSADVGALAAAGLVFAVGANVSLLVDARYDLGLVNINDSPDPGSIKNRAFSVQAGVAIDLGGR